MRDVGKYLQRISDDLRLAIFCDVEGHLDDRGKGRGYSVENLMWFCGLGMPVCEALAYVELHKSLFDVVHVKYNDEVSIIALAEIRVL